MTTTDESRPADARTTRAHIRGSALLVAGRVLALAINFASQVLVVRYLAKEAYGSFIYAMGLVQLGFSVNIFGFHKTVARFLPIYQEQKEHGKLLGALLLSFGTLIGAGLAVVVGFHLGHDLVSDALNIDPLTVSLLLILIVLLPLETFDALLVQLLAVFAGAKAIFFRRYVVAPLLRFGAVLLVLVVQGDVHLLAWAFLVGTVIGAGIYGGVLFDLLRRQGLFGHLRELSVPFREILGFSLPLLSSDLLFVARTFVLIAILEFFHPTSVVAEFGAPMSVVRLNSVIGQNFTYLFLPVASRLFVRREMGNVLQMYRQAICWVTVLTFPVFVVTCALAEPLTVFLFGERYANAASVMAIMTVGMFVSTALGFNLETLKVMGRVRPIVVADLLASAAVLGLAYLMIPRMGAAGAAFAAASALVLHTVLMQASLWRIASFTPGTGYLRLCGMAAAGMAVVYAVQRLFHPPLAVGLVLAAVAGLSVLRLSRELLDLDGTFPELLRFRVIRWALGAGPAGR